MTFWELLRFHFCSFTIVSFNLIGYEEFCKLRRVLPTEVAYILIDLQNSSYPTKGEFNNCFIIPSK